MTANEISPISYCKFASQNLDQQSDTCIAAWKLLSKKLH